MNRTQEIRRLASLYPVTVRWSGEDHCFIGTVHRLAGDCCHGDDPRAVFREACEIADELVGISLRDGLDLPAPEGTAMKGNPDAAKIRSALKLSQSAFADVLGISVRTLHKWEQHVSTPSGAAKTLLKVAAFDPGILQKAVVESSRKKPGAKKSGIAASPVRYVSIPQAGRR